jgi:HECT-domain (ubiquitin-transferase)
MEVNRAAVERVESISDLDEDTWEALEIEWNVVSSAGGLVSVHPLDRQAARASGLSASETAMHDEGGDELVEYAQRAQYRASALHHLTHETDAQQDAVREGLETVVPAAALRLFQWEELEEVVCGPATYTVEALRANTRLDGYTPQDECVRWLFEVLAEFDTEARTQFLVFCSGRSRVPQPADQWGFHITVKRAQSVSCHSLPTASTCTEELILPVYQSKAQLERKLRTAIASSSTFGLM